MSLGLNYFTGLSLRSEIIFGVRINSSGISLGSQFILEVEVFGLNVFGGLSLAFTMHYNFQKCYCCKEKVKS